MSVSLQCPAGVAVLRPWPFGPPLRGRAPHRDASRQPPAWTDPNGCRGYAFGNGPFGGLAYALSLSSLL